MSNNEDVKHEFPYQIDEFYLDLQSDGSTIAILDQAAIIKMPFPGLRPFKTSEFQLFKGRVDQTEELIKRLKEYKVLAVIGSSGTGKSSLVRAGLIPQLLGGYLHEAGSKWNIAICRPGKNPIENLTIALSSVKNKSKNRNDIIKGFKEIEPLLTNSVYGILDVNELLNSGKTDEEKHNLLIIVDQFEEIFRFQQKNSDSPDKEDIGSHFVNLLLKASLNSDSSVYVVITMRTEFLGDCVRFKELPKAINKGHYLVPQLSRNELKEAIQGPIRLANKKIEPGLVELLANEIDENKLKENLDQLPILQHALMRSYNQAMLEGADTEINYEHYEQIGTMRRALANHAEAKYAELGDANVKEGTPSKKQEIARTIFQALTDTSTEHKGGRRPIELSVIYAVADSLNASHQEVDEVINHFREMETSFIMPPINTALHSNLVLDISHESLMRNWERLNGWMDEEAKNGRLYKMLDERRVLNEQGGGNDQLIRGILLTEMMCWKELGHNSAWASRYHTKSELNNNETDESIFNKNLAFLTASHTDLLNKIELAKRKRRRIVTNLTIALGIAGVLSVLFLVMAKRAKDSEIRAKIYTEIAKEEKERADLLTFKIKLNLRKWWNDSYITDNTRKLIRDSLVTWCITRHNKNDSILAGKLDYSLRMLHEANAHPIYQKLIFYVHHYNRNNIIDSAISKLKSLMLDSLDSYSANDKALTYIRENIGIDYFRENNYAGTILIFSEILDRHAGYAQLDRSDSLLAYDMIGRAYYSSNNYEKSISFYKRADSLKPLTVLYLANLGEAYIANHDTVNANDALKKALKIDPNNSRTLELFGQLLYISKKYNDAIEEFNKVIRLDSVDSDRYSGLIKTHKKLNSRDTEMYIRSLKNVNVTSSVTYGWLIKTYKKLNRPGIDKYIKLLKTASIASYDDWFVLASYYDDAEQDNAIHWYKKYISKVGKTFWLPYNNIALDFCRLKEPNCDEAIKYADSAIALTGTEFALTQRQIQLSQADFVQSRTQFVPDPPNPYAHKAYAYLIKSEAEKEDSIKYKHRALALVNIENALNIDPGYPKTHFYYACYYALNGKKKEAVYELRVAQQKGFNDKRWIERESMLNPIRDEAGYQELIAELKKDPTAN